MNGLFSDILEKCAHWFLYIFIAADAPLNSTIMRKRANQIKWLKRLDAVNNVYNYNDLVLIVQRGIIARFGKTPAEVLTTIYNTAKGNTGVSSAISDKATADALTNLQNLKLTQTTSTGTTEVKNFWDGLDEVLTFIKEILTILGIGNTTEIKPTPYEWQKPDSGNTTLSSVGDVLPWAMAGGIIWFLSTGQQSGKPKKKGK